jgi:hypothetical protein
MHVAKLENRIGVADRAGAGVACEAGDGGSNGIPVPLPVPCPYA